MAIAASTRCFAIAVPAAPASSIATTHAAPAISDHFCKRIA
jgi:hypothetical protein